MKENIKNSISNINDNLENDWNAILSNSQVYNLRPTKLSDIQLSGYEIESEIPRLLNNLYINSKLINLKQLQHNFCQSTPHEIYQAMNELCYYSTRNEAFPKNHENIHSNDLYKYYQNRIKFYLTLKKTFKANINTIPHNSIINELVHNITVGTIGAFVTYNIAYPIFRIVSKIHKTCNYDSHKLDITYALNMSYSANKNPNSITIQCISKSNIFPRELYSDKEKLPVFEDFEKYKKLFNDYSQNKTSSIKNANFDQKLTSMFYIEYTITAIDNNKVQYTNFHCKLLLPNYSLKNNETSTKSIIEKLRALLIRLWNIIVRNTKNVSTLNIGSYDTINDINHTVDIQHTCKNKVVISCNFNNSEIINAFTIDTANNISKQKSCGRAFSQ
ncbi:hypothetical protein [Candidatus Neoehrlichia procyonis]|uniref:Uncharacterized protein n=1 Tax=Candidatus Neoehrlichia procyonis str. RAC413 TaxID=1359163 RepID=A0A0F3NPN6_9RICK|nr:hypothetical protein [Candidatus Neoehrlichia lotoris]KJV69642.1 hypothetical protein NLO413_1042 [Candidatus Neoehrlichia lotoris str. RAC413]